MQIYEHFLKPKNYFDEISIKYYFISKMTVKGKEQNVGNDVRVGVVLSQNTYCGAPTSRPQSVPAPSTDGTKTWHST